MKKKNEDEFYSIIILVSIVIGISPVFFSGVWNYFFKILNLNNEYGFIIKTFFIFSFIFSLISSIIFYKGKNFWEKLKEFIFILYSVIFIQIISCAIALFMRLIN